MEEPHEEPSVETAVEVERGPELRLKIARAFLANRYPLSEKGEELRARVEKAVEQAKAGDQKTLEVLRPELPTVENPRLELFKDFELTRTEAFSAFGPDLRVIQLSKGCRHQCSHCAAAAEKNVEMMPFVALLKIVESVDNVAKDRIERLKKFRKEVIERLNGSKYSRDWSDIKRRILETGKEKWNFGALDDYDLLDIGRNKHAIRRDDSKSSADWGSVVTRAERITIDLIGDLRDEFEALEDMHLVERTESNVFRTRQPRNVGDELWCVNNYFDSDPFDWRDTTFLHDDGTPADYGDAFLAQLPITTNIDITTAGWPRSDSVSRRAAEKITKFIRQNKEEFPIVSGSRKPGTRNDTIRVSLHPFETGTSRGDMERYLADMKDVLKALEPARVGIIVIKADGPEEMELFKRTVIGPLREEFKESAGYTRQLTNEEYWWKVNHFSGRAEDKSFGDEHDVMGCMPGKHILPNGLIADLAECEVERGEGSKKYTTHVVVPGTRPKPTGIRLYDLPPKKRGGK